MQEPTCVSRIASRTSAKTGIEEITLLHNHWTLVRGRGPRTISLCTLAFARDVNVTTFWFCIQAFTFAGLRLGFPLLLPPAGAAGLPCSVCG